MYDLSPIPPFIFLLINYVRPSFHLSISLRIIFIWGLSKDNLSNQFFFQIIKTVYLSIKVPPHSTVYSVPRGEGGVFLTRGTIKRPRRT